MIFVGPGPDFGSPPSFMRRKLVSVLNQSGKTCTLIDDTFVVKRYSDESCNSISVFSDNEALSRVIKEVSFPVTSSYNELLIIIFF